MRGATIGDRARDGRVGDDVAMLSFRTLPADVPPASDLLAAMVAEMNAVYEGTIDGRDAPTATPAELGPPGGAFVVGFLDGKAVCAGGVKRLSEDVAEIKRMYVVPHARSRGLARMLLGALEDAARELGYTRVRLDTGARQPGARALYESAGYRRIDDYNANPWAAFWGEKALSSPD
jgi:GNAT superfamily N-acetyltransferase